MLKHFLRFLYPQKIKFRTLVQLWQKDHVASLRQTTQIRYQQVIENSFSTLMDSNIDEIDKTAIDRWLNELFLNNKKSKKIRGSFHYELLLLKSIFNFYCEKFDNPAVISPIKKYHFEKSILSHHALQTGSKNLTEHDFNQFLKSFKRTSLDRTIHNLAIIQYYQALRVSEAAALHWEDISLDDKNPSQSFMRVQRSIKWFRSQAKVEFGFKNSVSLAGGIKELPVFPKVFAVLSRLQKNHFKHYKTQPTGLVFLSRSQQPLTYRKIQYSFNKAFAKSKLPYRSTHILRHGGCRRLYEKNSDLEIAKQLLGNKSLKTTLVYAQKSNEALIRAAQAEYRLG